MDRISHIWTYMNLVNMMLVVGHISGYNDMFNDFGCI